MYSIYDVNGHRGELASSSTVSIIYGIAKKLELDNLKAFLDNGYSIDIDGVLSDLNEIEFERITEIEDVVNDFISYVTGSKEVLIISDSVE